MFKFNSLLNKLKLCHKTSNILFCLISSFTKVMATLQATELYFHFVYIILKIDLYGNLTRNYYLNYIQIFKVLYKTSALISEEFKIFIFIKFNLNLG